MTATSIALGVAGAACLFAPAELAASFGAVVNAPLQVLVQIAGGLYLGLAMANWMAKVLPFGGIYGRPISMANFTHFLIGALALFKHVHSSGFTWPSASALFVYALFAVLFGYLVFFDRSGAKP